MEKIPKFDLAAQKNLDEVGNHRRGMLGLAIGFSVKCYSVICSSLKVLPLGVENGKEICRKWLETINAKNRA